MPRANRNSLGESGHKGRSKLACLMLNTYLGYDFKIQDFLDNIGMVIPKYSPMCLKVQMHFHQWGWGLST